MKCHHHKRVFRKKWKTESARRGWKPGARVLNQTIPQVVARLADKLEVRHPVGKGSVESVTALYGEHADSVKITEFIDDMAVAYALRGMW